MHNTTSLLRGIKPYNAKFWKIYAPVVVKIGGEYFEMIWSTKAQSKILVIFHCNYGNKYGEMQIQTT